MKGKNTIEGEIFRVGGNEPKCGDSLTVIVNEDAISFKEEIVIVGEKGFKAYPSEKLFLELDAFLRKKLIPVGVVSEIKKEGTYRALFRVD